MLCRVRKKCMVRRDGESYTPDSQSFEVEDSAAALLIADGLLEAVDDVVVTEVVPMMVSPDVPMSTPQLGEVPMAHEQIVDDIVELCSLTSVTDAIFGVLVAAGIDSVELLAAAQAEDLVALKGIGAKRARRLIEEAEAALEYER